MILHFINIRATSVETSECKGQLYTIADKQDSEDKSRKRVEEVGTLKFLSFFRNFV